MDIPEKKGFILEEDGVEKEEAEAPGHEKTCVLGGIKLGAPHV